MSLKERQRGTVSVFVMDGGTPYGRLKRYSQRLCDGRGYPLQKTKGYSQHLYGGWGYPLQENKGVQSMSQCPVDVNIPREEKDDSTETWLITVTETPSMVAKYKKNLCTTTQTVRIGIKRQRHICINFRRI